MYLQKKAKKNILPENPTAVVLSNILTLCIPFLPAKSPAPVPLPSSSNTMFSMRFMVTSTLWVGKSLPRKWAGVLPGWECQPLGCLADLLGREGEWGRRELGKCLIKVFWLERIQSGRGCVGIAFLIVKTMMDLSKMVTSLGLRKGRNLKLKCCESLLLTDSLSYGRLCKITASYLKERRMCIKV